MSRNRIIPIGVVIALMMGFGLWRVSKAPCWQLVGEVTCRVETNEPVVALSFDDGPTKEGVDAVLPELQKRNVHATFFLIGNRMDLWSGEATRLAKAGMEIGNHSYSHRRMIGASQNHYQEEIEKTDALIKKEGYNRPTLFRPPFGKRLIGLPLALEKTGHRMVTWDVADDAKNNITPEAYAADIVNRARPGSIILIHPMYHTNMVEREAVPLVLDGLAAKGLKVVTVSELLEREQK